MLSQVSKRDQWNPAESPYSLFPAPCSLLFSLHFLGDVQQNADAGQGDEDRGAAGGFRDYKVNIAHKRILATFIQHLRHLVGLAFFHHEDHIF